jgi:hypothetical protein
MLLRCTCIVVVVSMDPGLLGLEESILPREVHVLLLVLSYVLPVKDCYFRHDLKNRLR